MIRIGAGARSSLDLIPSALHTSCIRQISNEKNYYDVLGVSRNATTSEIKQAFYEKSKQLHPDNCPGCPSTAAFVELKQAYDTLRRPADRAVYDNAGRYPNPNIHSSKYHHHYGPRYEFDQDWRYFWRENPKDPGYAEFQQRSREQWRWIIRWTGIGAGLVILYNIGYVAQIHYRNLQLSKLSDEDEIAKSFLRQAEFKGKDVDIDIADLRKIFKADVDEAWRRRQEEIAARNPNEIREEYRWLRAVQDPDHTRRIKARREEIRRKEIEYRHSRSEEELS